ncbi:hypothetical protein DDT91_18985 [Algoriphagus sp. AK58]|nr:hypothetical protein [Algoriphagus sp. AK58]
MINKGLISVRLSIKEKDDFFPSKRSFNGSFEPIIMPHYMREVSLIFIRLIFKFLKFSKENRKILSET